MIDYLICWGKDNMAKANRPPQSHEKYKIPIKDRKKFMGSNKDKWVNEKKYNQYISWSKNAKR